MCKTKVCTKCKEEKLLELFVKKKDCKDGVTSQCKKCKNKQEKLNKLTRKRHIKPEEGFKTCSTCKKEKHVDEFHLSSFLYMGVCSDCKICTNYKKSERRKNNRSKANEKAAEYRKTHRQEILLNKKNYRESCKKDSLFKLKQIARGLIRKSFIKFRKGKLVKGNKSSEDLLGCFFEEFKNHIESQFLDWMSWDNHGACPESTYYKCSWHVDHIIPLSYAKNEEELYLLNHWSNFQPMCGKRNLEKLAKIHPCTNLDLKITFWEDNIEYLK